MPASPSSRNGGATGDARKKRPPARSGSGPVQGADAAVSIRMPQAIESERVILGTMLIDPIRINEVLPMLGADGEPLFSELHREIYRVLIAMYDRGSVVLEPSVIVQEMRANPRLAPMDLPTLLADLELAVIAPESLMAHVDVVMEKWRLRRLIEVCATAVEDAQAPAASSSELLMTAERAVFEIANDRTNERMLEIHELTNLTLTNIEARKSDHRAVSGIATGFIELDEKTSGFQRSDLLILGARPSMGKTAFALNIAQHVAVKEKQHVGIFSMEMSAEQLTQRMLATMSRIDLKKVRSGRLDRREMESLAEAADLLGNSPLMIDDTFGLSILELRSRARRMASRAGNLGLIVIDYLQLMSGSTKRAENRQQEISEISRSLKALARELHVPVLALSQLSRQNEQRKLKDKRPILSDLRESGAIEQDADVVMFVHREEYYRRKEAEAGEARQKGQGGNPPPQRPAGASGASPVELAEIIIAKQRNGPVGTVEVLFVPDNARFLNKAKVRPGDSGGDAPAF